MGRVDSIEVSNVAIQMLHGWLLSLNKPGKNKMMFSYELHLLCAPQSSSTLMHLSTLKSLFRVHSQHTHAQTQRERES